MRRTMPDGPKVRLRIFELQSEVACKLFRANRRRSVMGARSSIHNLVQAAAVWSDRPWWLRRRPSWLRLIAPLTRGQRGRVRPAFWCQRYKHAGSVGEEADQKRGL